MVGRKLTISLTKKELVGTIIISLMIWICFYFYFEPVVSHWHADQIGETEFEVHGNKRQACTPLEFYAEARTGPSIERTTIRFTEVDNRDPGYQSFGVWSFGKRPMADAYRLKYTHRCFGFLPKNGETPWFVVKEDFQLDNHQFKWDPRTTPNFVPTEFSCNCGKCDGTPYMHQEFMDRLQTMRTILDEPMIITDGGGYRCPLHKDRVARPGTWHNGRAADIAVKSGKHRIILLEAARQAGFGGFGFGRGFLHIDSRPTVQLTSWTY